MKKIKEIIEYYEKQLPKSSYRFLKSGKKLDRDEVVSIHAKLEVLKQLEKELVNNNSL